MQFFSLNSKHTYFGSSSGVHIILGLKRTTGTLLKCSIGMFIFVKHLVHTVRLQRVHRWPQGPKIPNLNCRKKKILNYLLPKGKTVTGIYLVLRQRKHTFRLSTSWRTRPSVGKASTSAFVSTVRICTISARVNDSLQYFECHSLSVIYVILTYHLEKWSLAIHQY